MQFLQFLQDTKKTRHTSHCVTGLLRLLLPAEDIFVRRGECLARRAVYCFLPVQTIDRQLSIGDREAVRLLGGRHDHGQIQIDRVLFGGMPTPEEGFGGISDDMKPRAHVRPNCVRNLIRVGQELLSVSNLDFVSPKGNDVPLLRGACERGNGESPPLDELYRAFERNRVAHPAIQRVLTARARGEHIERQIQFRLDGLENLLVHTHSIHVFSDYGLKT